MPKTTLLVLAALVVIVALAALKLVAALGGRRRVYVLRSALFTPAEQAYHCA